jgi:hypothetical protein
VKRDDHLLDATRYLVVSGRDVMRGPRKPPTHYRRLYLTVEGAWMAI